jgi:hypothetical protein
MLDTHTTTYPSAAPLTSRAASQTMRVSTARDDTAVGRAGVIDVSRPPGAERTLLQALGSLAAATGIALLLPFVMLLVGLPIALGARGLLEVVAWLFPALR